MNRRLSYLFLAVGIALVFFGCSNKNSTEACVHEVTMNLDKGNYNAVIASSCANAMQIGAAYFGLAGFDVTQVINSFSKIGSGSSTSSAQSALTVYLSTLVTDASGASLAYMDDALQSYGSVTTSGNGDFTLDNYKDTQFYISLVDAVKALSLLKVVLPSGTDTTCDKNSNTVPDDADATACALLVSGGQTCGTWATYVQTGPLTFPTVTGTYYGLTITMTGVGSAPTPTCPLSYARLLYTSGTATVTATTDSTQTCIANQDNSQWPCPIIVNNKPLDLVSAVSDALNSSISSLNSSLTSSLTGTTSTDVQTAITDIQSQACPTSCSAVCPGASCPSTCTAPYTMNYCTSQDLANYLQTNL